jgi:hypothetical protein
MALSSVLSWRGTSLSHAFSGGNYGTPSEMRDHAGNIVAHTRTGVGQGDLWGGLFFEHGYQAALLDLSNHVTSVAAAHNRENPSDPML